MTSCFASAVADVSHLLRLQASFHRYLALHRAGTVSRQTRPPLAQLPECSNRHSRLSSHSDPLLPSQAKRHLAE